MNCCRLGTAGILKKFDLRRQGNERSIEILITDMKNICLLNNAAFCTSKELLAIVAYCWLVLAFWLGLAVFGWIGCSCLVLVCLFACLPVCLFACVPGWAVIGWLARVGCGLMENGYGWL